MVCELAASAFFLMVGEMVKADFLDFLTKGAIIH
jgi:hypothetical protein